MDTPATAYLVIAFNGMSYNDYGYDSPDEPYAVAGVYLSQTDAEEECARLNKDNYTDLTYEVIVTTLHA